MNMLIESIERAGLNRALIRDELASMTIYEGVTGTKQFDAVYTNRTPASLAILKDGKFLFYAQDEVFSDKLNFSE